MITDLEKYQGVVIRQIVVASQKPLRIESADTNGRLDSFKIEDVAFHVKFSSKRLSPWRFTFLLENLNELAELSRTSRAVWIFLVCGDDGVVGITLSEFNSIISPSEKGVAWLRVSRSRNSMYRIGGGLKDLPNAKPRGPQGFLSVLELLSHPPRAHRPRNKEQHNDIERKRRLQCFGT